MILNGWNTYTSIPLSQVYYAIESKDGSDRFFSIDKETGEIFTKQEFDREEKQAYAIFVKAFDGAPSDRPNMKQHEPNSGKRLSISSFSLHAIAAAVLFLFLPSYPSPFSPSGFP